LVSGLWFWDFYQITLYYYPLRLIYFTIHSAIFFLTRKGFTFILIILPFNFFNQKWVAVGLVGIFPNPNP